MQNKKSFVLIGIVLLVLIAGAVVYATLADRADGTHNVGQVGFFTTNIGQFMPYGGQFEKTIEYPINSGHICVYRQTIMLGVPVNVISAASGRFEEFDAVGGYHNRDNGKIAMSDKPETWPLDESNQPYWPVHDENGDPLILSQQDSYCVYSDSTNWRYAENGEDDMLLDIRVHQSIYTWGVPDADKFIVLKFEIENTRDELIEDMYFNFYSDLDIGGIEEEWTDDCVGFDKDRELVYFYDADNYSDEWEEEDPFMAGVTFLKTPNDGGITDWHWIDVDIDEVSVEGAVYDSISYYLMRSDTTFFHNNPDYEVSDYFHLGDNPINGTHYDDPATSRLTDDDGNLVGGPMVAYIANGPFDIQPGERAEFLVAVVVGDNEADLLAVTDQVWQWYEDDFAIPIIPAPHFDEPEAGDNTIKLFWDNALDIQYTNLDGENDLEGYKLYRTRRDQFQNWQEVATIPMQYKGDTSVQPRAYEYQDNDVANGVIYYYNLTAYRTTDGGTIEQSPFLKDRNELDTTVNAVAIEPTTDPATSKSELDDIRVVPNPFVISATWDLSRLGEVSSGEPQRNIEFQHLPTPCTVRIFTVDGDLVQTLRHTDSDGSMKWNLLTSEQRPVVSGMYFYQVESDLGEKVGRFAIIR